MIGLTRTRHVLLVLVTGVALIAGMYGGALAGESEPKYGGTLVAALADDPPVLDPHFTASNAARTVLHNIFNTLFDVDDNLQVVPELVESWDVLDEGMAYIFRLHRNVVFHDGTPLDAEAVQYNFHRMMDPELGSPRGSELAFVDRVLVEDEYTIRLEMERPYAALLPALASWSGMMVSPAAVEELGEDFAANPVGSGPFRFVEHILDDRVELQRFDEYWREGLPYLDRVIYRPFADGDARVLNLETGAVDIIATVPGRDVDRLQENPEIAFSSVPGLGFRGLWINTESIDLGDARRRAAVSAAMDRQAIVDIVFGDAAVPALGPFSPATWVVDLDDPAPERDLDKARRLLAEAGDPDGFSFTLFVTPDEESIRVASIIASMVGEVGIQMNIQQMEFGTIIGRMQDGNFTAAQIELSPRNDPDLSAYPWWHTHGGINWSQLSNPELDHLLETARASVDHEERRRLYRESLEIFNQEFPYIFVYHLNEMKAYRNDVMGYPHIPDMMMRFEEVWLDR